MFARKRDDGNYDILHEDGSAATIIDANAYPVGSDLSTRYEHPEGIVLDLDGITACGIGVEGMPEYCTQNAGDCDTCSLSSYGRDCANNPI